MSGHRPPPLDLSLVIFMPPAHVVPAIPLKPPTWIIGVNPAFLLPIGEWFRSLDLEEIQVPVMSFRAQLRIFKPLPRKLVDAICHVFPAENPHCQHLLRRQLRLKLRREISPWFFR